ncbi:MAG: hypothetical protein F6J96_17675 [Symploca sp. SIO1C2]|nr:hypothetical protein [Symploca sp. SIO1C2]
MIKNLAFWLENIDTPRAQALRPNQNEYYLNVAGIEMIRQQEVQAPTVVS